MSEQIKPRPGMDGPPDVTPGELALRGTGIPYSLPPTVDGARTLQEFAERSGLLPKQVLKSLLLDIDGDRYALLLVPGDRSADLAALRRHFSARSVRLADREVVESVTGYKIGTVTPLGSRTPDLPILLDTAALGEEIVSLGTGRPGRHVRVSPAGLAQALSAATGAFARPTEKSGR